jgi:hypothetical protein
MSLQSIIDHYRALLSAEGWTVVLSPPPANPLCADRSINGQQVRFVLSPEFIGTPTSRVGTDIIFLPNREDFYCSR